MYKQAEHLIIQRSCQSRSGARRLRDPSWAEAKKASTHCRLQSPGEEGQSSSQPVKLRHGFLESCFWTINVAMMEAHATAPGPISAQKKARNPAESGIAPAASAQYRVYLSAVKGARILPSHAGPARVRPAVGSLANELTEMTGLLEFYMKDRIPAIPRVRGVRKLNRRART